MPVGGGRALRWPMLSAGVFGAHLQGALPLFPAGALGCGSPMPWPGQPASAPLPLLCWWGVSSMAGGNGQRAVIGAA